MLRRLLLASTILFGLTLNAGCWLMPSYDTPVIEGEDVSIETPEQDGFRGSGVRGEVYQLALDTAYDTNDWVSETVAGMADITRTLNGYPEITATASGACTVRTTTRTAATSRGW